MFWYALLYVFSSFAIILARKRELVALLLLSFECLVTVNVLKLLLTVPWAGHQFVIVVFPDHTHFLIIEKRVSVIILEKKFCGVLCTEDFASFFNNTIFSLISDIFVSVVRVYDLYGSVLFQYQSRDQSLYVCCGFLVVRYCYNLLFLSMIDVCNPQYCICYFRIF